MAVFEHLDYPSEYELCRELKINVFIMPEALGSISDVFLHTNSVLHQTFLGPNTWVL